MWHHIRTVTGSATDFGVLQGRLKSIGSDALLPDEFNKTYRFPQVVSLDSQQFRLKVGQRLPLQVGMSLTANIKLRKVIDLQLLLGSSRTRPTPCGASERARLQAAAAEPVREMNRVTGWRVSRALAGVVSLVLLAGAPAARAVPRLELKPYPAPAAGEVRWVIQLPGVRRPSPDPLLSPDPADWRVELIVGRELEVDCNRVLLGGRIRRESVPGWGYSIYRVSGGELRATTRMACPPDQPPRRAFVPLAGPPTVVPYNASLPIVIYAPKDLQVRWRLWKAETRQQEARRQ